MALYNLIHNDIQLKTPRWIQQQKINKETKGERTHLWDSNNNRTIGITGRLKKIIQAQDLNRKLGLQLIGEMKRSVSSRDEREREVDKKVRKLIEEIKRLESSRGEREIEVDEEVR
jgi:hypothetical protein